MEKIKVTQNEQLDFIENKMCEIIVCLNKLAELQKETIRIYNKNFEVIQNYINGTTR